MVGALSEFTTGGNPWGNQSAAGGYPYPGASNDSYMDLMQGSQPANQNVWHVLVNITAVADEEADLDRVLATVMFTDIVGSTEKAASLGDRQWARLVERHHALVRSRIVRYRGTEVDTAGDGFFAYFDGPARAVKCAQAVVEGVQPLGIQVRAGVHTGECEST